MADISKCEGTDCPIATKCWRYLAPDTPRRQSYVVNPGIRDENGTVIHCDLFWVHRN